METDTLNHWRRTIKRILTDLGHFSLKTTPPPGVMQSWG